MNMDDRATFTAVRRAVRVRFGTTATDRVAVADIGANVGQLDETDLPGIGRRIEFFSDEGRRLGVVQHHSGRREVFVCSPDDPDRSELSISLSEADAEHLAEALKVASASQDSAPVTYEVEGLVFEWLDVAADSPVAGKSIAELQIRTRTGASVVAVIRRPTSVPAPEPDFVLEADDTLVVAGTAEGVDNVLDLVRPRNA